MRILITGGAGFVGSSLAKLYREKYPSSEVVAFDNLKRRGSEFNLPIFKERGIQFVHGDIRSRSDFESLTGHFDLFIEASAEPSVLAGMQGDSPAYAIETNLVGTINALEYARKNCGTFVFLSTSRVYSIPALLSIELKEEGTRFVPKTSNDGALELRGLSSKGISEEFSTGDYRSIYGSTKLSSELLIQEYAQAYGLKTIINRCGVIAGPGQFGKVDQGVFTLWVARHFFGQSLKYTGFGGKGLQVRDLLHPSDLFDLIEKQQGAVAKYNAQVFNIGGSREVSTSLAELTNICREVTGREVKIASDMTTSSVDIPYYVTDISKAHFAFQWTPKKNVPAIVTDIKDWLAKNEAQLKGLFT